jgi:membrane associated rhomboid family serine protease
MIPIKDTVPRRNFPLATFALIAVNGLVFLVQLSLPEQTLTDIVYLFGLVPARYAHPAWAEIAGYPLDTYWPFVTNMFLHGGWFHVIANMWSLYLFGDNVEDRLGPVRFLLFYLLAGLAANLVHFVINHHSTMPVIGASGAIAGVMAAYLRLFPTARIITLFPIFFIPYFLEVPAYFFMGLWFVMQLLSGAASLAGAEGGIAWWAHIGGFAVGYFLIKPLCSKRLGGCHADEVYRYIYR